MTWANLVEAVGLVAGAIAYVIAWRWTA